MNNDGVASELREQLETEKDKRKLLEAELDRLRRFTPGDLAAEMNRLDPLTRALCTIHTLMREAEALREEFRRATEQQVRFCCDYQRRACAADMEREQERFRADRMRELCVEHVEIGGSTAEIVARIRAL